jgi:glycerol-3-phosphate dehydrogenase
MLQITVAGGKWTTYREMAQDCVNAAVKLGKLRATDCVTRTTQLLGAATWSPNHFIKLIQDFGRPHLKLIDASW